MDESNLHKHRMGLPDRQPKDEEAGPSTSSMIQASEEMREYEHARAPKHRPKHWDVVPPAPWYSYCYSPKVCCPSCMPILGKSLFFVIAVAMWFLLPLISRATAASLANGHLAQTEGGEMEGLASFWDLGFSITYSLHKGYEGSEEGYWMGFAIQAGAQLAFLAWFCYAYFWTGNWSMLLKYYIVMILGFFLNLVIQVPVPRQYDQRQPIGTAFFLAITIHGADRAVTPRLAWILVQLHNWNLMVWTSPRFKRLYVVSSLFVFLAACAVISWVWANRMIYTQNVILTFFLGYFAHTQAEQIAFWFAHDVAVPVSTTNRASAAGLLAKASANAASELDDLGRLDDEEIYDVGDEHLSEDDQGDDAAGGQGDTLL